MGIIAAVLVGLCGSTLAPGSASAFALRYGSNTGSVVPAGTTWSAASAGAFDFTNSSSGGVLWNCQTSALSGVTAAGGALSVTGPTAMNAAFANCHLSSSTTGPAVLVNPTFKWTLTPTANPSANTFIGNLSNVNLTVTCPGSTTATYTGTLPLTETNQFTQGAPATGSRFVFQNAVRLTKAGGTCSVLPATVDVSATYKLTQVGGAAVTVTNNLWETTS